MAKERHVCLEGIVGSFDALEDPRDRVNRKHPLVSVVVIAMLAEAGGPTAIAKWAALKVEFLTALLPLPHGIPRKDVFRRVLALLKPEAFQACFVQWLRARAAAPRAWARCTASAPHLAHLAGAQVFAGIDLPPRSYPGIGQGPGGTLRVVPPVAAYGHERVANRRHDGTAAQEAEEVRNGGGSRHALVG